MHYAIHTTQNLFQDGSDWKTPAVAFLSQIQTFRNGSTSEATFFDSSTHSTNIGASNMDFNRSLPAQDLAVPRTFFFNVERNVGKKVNWLFAWSKAKKNAVAFAKGNIGIHFEPGRLRSIHKSLPFTRWSGFTRWNNELLTNLAFLSSLSRFGTESFDARTFLGTSANLENIGGGNHFDDDRLRLAEDLEVRWTFFFDVEQNVGKKVNLCLLEAKKCCCFCQKKSCNTFWALLFVRHVPKPTTLKIVPKLNSLKNTWKRGIFIECTNIQKWLRWCENFLWFTREFEKYWWQPRFWQDETRSTHGHSIHVFFWR